MPRPAVFFDRDNTLIACHAYLGDPSKVVLVDRAAVAIAGVRALGYRTVIVSNQAGVGRGFFTEADVRAVNARLDQLLRSIRPDAIIDAHYFCPFHRDAVVPAYRRDSELRKPRPGMLLQAARELDLDLQKSWMIGDTSKDIEAGRAAGCRTILVRHAHLQASPDAAEPPQINPDFVVNTVAQASQKIHHEDTKAAKKSDV